MCPYIDGVARDSLHYHIRPPMDVGELTYSLQQIICAYVDDQALRYQQIAEVLGALEGCKLDFIERIVLPYEQKKLAENGDVWPASLTDHGAAHTVFEHHPHLENELETGLGWSERYRRKAPDAYRPDGNFVTRDGEIIRLSGDDQERS